MGLALAAISVFPLPRKRGSAWIGTATVCAVILAASTPARAQHSTADGIKDCTTFAAKHFKAHNSAFRTFTIDAASVDENKFADKVGSQFVSTVYLGRGTYEAGQGPREIRFICLHAGVGNGAVFIYPITE